MNEVDVDACVHLIRQAMNGDEALQARETFRFHFACRRQGFDDGRAYYVLTGPVLIIGLVGLHRYLWGPPENVWLAWFAVDPAFQRQGLGTYLLRHAIGQARRQGRRQFLIETYASPEFARARAFYQAQGFTEVGRIRAYLPNGADMVVYAKTLIQPYEPIHQGTHHAFDRGAGAPRHARA